MAFVNLTGTQSSGGLLAQSIATGTKCGFPGKRKFEDESLTKALNYFVRLRLRSKYNAQHNQQKGGVGLRFLYWNAAFVKYQVRYATCLA